VADAASALGMMRAIVDALSHIGTFFEAAPGLTKEEQRAQVTLFEDHLRRTMMEAWEQMIEF
jgi:hypothetical protein